jgi:formate C-acetyltransferase
MTSFEEFFEAYKKQQLYMIEMMVHADNAVDYAHSVRCPLPFQSCLCNDCIEKGTSLQEGGAHYNFTGPQGFGIANMTDALLAMKTLVFEEKKVSMSEMKQALADNFGKGIIPKKALELTTEVAKQLDAQGVEVTADIIKAIYTNITTAASISDEKKARYQEILDMIAALPKYGNDLPEVDDFAREVGNTYTKPFENFTNPRGGMFQAGLYPVSANVPLGFQTGATPDGRLAFTPIADGVGPASGRDVKGPTATANSVARLDHGIASNGTLFNQKFHPSALTGMGGLEKFVAYLRGYFDQKGMHVQYNVVSRETLLDAQRNPEKYKNLVVRVAGYSALFTSLSRSLQDDIINRTEQSGL